MLKAWTAGAGVFSHFFVAPNLLYLKQPSRREMKPQVAKTRGDKTFKGQVVVLVDSRSASAAEIFARLLQLEKRGVVLGDHSAGAVMQSRNYPHEAGIDVVAFWGV